MHNRVPRIVLGLIAGSLVAVAVTGDLRAEPLEQSQNAIEDCIAYQAQRVNGALIIEETTAVEACQAAIGSYADGLAESGVSPGTAHDQAENFARESYRSFERKLPPCPLPSV